MRRRPGRTGPLPTAASAAGRGGRGEAAEGAEPDGLGRDPERLLSNPTPPVEIEASGIGFEVAWLEGGTIEATGNSFATPHVAGLVARILGEHPGLTVFQVKTVLRALAANVARGGPGGGGRRGAEGAGGGGRTDPAP
jgi:subtilisin family serine protease